MSIATLQDFLEVLVRNHAFLAHCAGFSKGIGDASTNSLGYLERLKQAAESMKELSCSTIRPGDMHDWSIMNYTGKVGLVLLPNAATSITYASPKDAGSQIDSSNPGRRYSGQPAATPELVETAILSRLPSSYNELGVINYTVVGVFMDEPVQYSGADEVVTLTPEDISSYFSSKRLFYLKKGQLYECVGSGDSLVCGAQVSISQIYGAATCAPPLPAPNPGPRTPDRATQTGR